MDKQTVKPIVSVIMAVFNGEKYLIATIESILNQTFKDFELIIVDDASTDGTNEIIRRFMENDKRIKLLTNERNCERAISRNRAIEISTGEYIATNDADDISLPDRLARQVDFLQKNPDIAMVGTGFICIDENGGHLPGDEPLHGYDKNIVHFMCNPTIMARKTCLIDIGGFTESLVPAEDYDLNLRISQKYKIAVLEESLYMYRVHPGSSTSLQKSKMLLHSSYAIYLSKNMLDSSKTDIIKIVSCLDARKLISDAYLVWGQAAYKLRLFDKAGHFIRQAILQNKFNLPAWYAFFRTRSLLFKESVLQKFYPFFHLIRKYYWDSRADFIHARWGYDRDDYAVLSDIIKHIKPEKILDIGCGSGRLFPLYINENIREVIGQDISPKALEIADRYNHPNIKTVEKNILDLDYGPQYFDLIISNRTLQHVNKNEIKKIAGKIADMGRFIYINEMSDSDYRDNLYYMFKHDYEALFKKHGFDIIKSGLFNKKTWILFGKRDE